MTEVLTARSQVPIFWIPGIPNDVVDRLPRHQCMWHTSLDIENCSQASQLAYHLALIHALFAGSFFALEGVDPADVAHARLDILDVELVLETDGKAVEGTNWSIVLCIVVI